jgi:hypothetical protein
MDSIKAEGADSAYYLYRIDRHMFPYEVAIDCYGDSVNPAYGAVLVGQDHYFGQKMLRRPDGTCLFLSSMNHDTFQLKTTANVGDQWTWLNGIIATVDSVVLDTVLGVPDSLKYISRTVGPQFILSKSHGFVRTFPILPFFDVNGLPNIVDFRLWGIPTQHLGGHLPAFGEIFQWDAGDHFGLTFHNYVTPNRYHGFHSIEVLAQTPGSRFEYQVTKETMQYHQSDTNSLQDSTYFPPATQTMTFDSLDFLRFNLLPYQSNPAVRTSPADYFQDGIYAYSAMHGRISLNFTRLPAYDSCAQALVPSEAIYAQTFTAGLGETAYSYSDVIGPEDRALYCYEKGSESWGTCIDLSTLISISEQEPGTLSLYPNPSTEQVRLTIPENSRGGKKMIRIFSSTGQCISQTEMQKGTTEAILNVSGLPNGIYLVQLVDERKVFNVGRMSVQR